MRPWSGFQSAVLENHLVPQKGEVAPCKHHHWWGQRDIETMPQQMPAAIIAKGAPMKY